MREIKTAVITGASGMIGITLAQYLLLQGIKVAVCVRPGSARAERLFALKNLRQNLHIIEADLEELKENRIFEEIYAKIGCTDVFFHFGWAGTFGKARNQMFLQNQNIRYTLDAVSLAKKLGCQVFLGAGSQAEYGRVQEGKKLRADTPTFPENGYGMAKLAAGQMSRVFCQELGISHIWMRILSVYGPWDTEKTMVMSAITTWMSKGSPCFSKGEQLWDYLYAKDAAKAFFLAAKSGVDGKVYPLGSGRTRPLKEYIKIIHDEIDPLAELGLGKLPYNQNQVMYLCADIEELTKDTGFVPEYTFEKGIQETVAWQVESAKLGR